MTIKSHIAISATISLALIALIACQQKTQAPKEQSKAVTEQKTKVEEVMKNFEQEAKVETEKLETKVEKAAKEFNDKAKEAEDKAKEETKEIETKVDEATEKVESEVKIIEIKIEDATESKEEQGSKNLLTNSDFSEGVDKWGHDKDVNVIEENGKNIVELIGSPNDQTRVWQSINTTSGHVYTLTLKVKSEQKNALVIFRDYQKGTEKIHYLNPTPEWKEYQKVLKSTKNGNYGIYLSCKEDGKFYYSDVSIIDTTPEE